MFCGMTAKIQCVQVYAIQIKKHINFLINCAKSIRVKEFFMSDLDKAVLNFKAKFSQENCSVSEKNKQKWKVLEEQQQAKQSKFIMKRR